MLKRLSFLLLTLVAVVMLMGLTWWFLNRPARPVAVSTPPPQRPTTQRSLPPGEEAVAWINGEPIPPVALAQRQAVDRAMAALFSAPVMEDAASLDRLVNEVLLLQAARDAGFAVAPEAVAAERAALLAAHGKSVAELEAALEAEGLPLDAFDAYLLNLLTARDFSAAAAQARGIPPDAYILELRESHDVQVVAGALAQVAATPAILPTATPEPALPTATTEPLPPTSTPPPAPPDEPRGVSAGQIAPDFALPTLTGEQITLDALRGQPAILSFWVTWCGHCRAQTPVLREAHAEHSAAVQFVGINVRETAEVAETYVADQGIGYPNALDADGAVAQRYQVSGLPTTYFLDAEGRVVARHVGQLTPQSLAQYLSTLK